MPHPTPNARRCEPRQARLDQLLASPAFGASGAEAALKASQLVAVDGDLETWPDETPEVSR